MSVEPKPANYTYPERRNPPKVKKSQVLLVANGDLRLEANRRCWPAQHELEQKLGAAIARCGYELIRAHPYKPDDQHGFISSQREGIEVFRNIDPRAKLIVAEAVWQYSHHLLPGLLAHAGPVLTVANWSGAWPGLVGLLNLNASLTKAGKKFSSLWSEDFTEPRCRRQLGRWIEKGRLRHEIDHVIPWAAVRTPGEERRLGKALAAQLRRDRAILGVFDEGCMGMFNAIVPDSLLNPTGVFKERLSQSALYYETTRVGDEEARVVYDWLRSRGLRLILGPDPASNLTEEQVLLQCKMYIAALRIADDFGCHAIGIQYQQGLKDLLPASDLVEGMLNNAERPPARSRDGARVLYEGQPLPHFNEVDECAGLDALMTYRTHRAMGQPVETTLHDIRWGDYDRSESTPEYVWVFLISGAAPPAHFIGGWAGASSERQPAMYFPSGGGTLKGVSKPGEIVWSRIFIAEDRLCMDLGRAKVVELPPAETERRWQATTPEWPIMHAVTYGVSRDQMMARHKSNHVQVAYANSADEADRALLVKASMAHSLGLEVALCGTRKDGAAW
jgi:hypothetical protein